MYAVWYVLLIVCGLFLDCIYMALMLCLLCALVIYYVLWLLWVCRGLWCGYGLYRILFKLVSGNARVYSWLCIGVLLIYVIFIVWICLWYSGCVVSCMSLVSGSVAILCGIRCVVGELACYVMLGISYSLYARIMYFLCCSFAYCLFQGLVFGRMILLCLAFAVEMFSFFRL